MGVNPWNRTHQRAQSPNGAKLAWRPVSVTPVGLTGEMHLTTRGCHPWLFTVAPLGLRNTTADGFWIVGLLPECGALNHTQLLPHLPKCFRRQVELFGRMRGGDLNSNSRLPLRHHRIAEADH